jgi:hypothetical protein
MKSFTLILLFLFIQNINSLTFSEALDNLEILESYIEQFKAEKKPSASVTHMITCYIREGSYSSSEWSIAGGSLPSDLVAYIKEKDEEMGTNAQGVKKYGEIELPSKEKLDFVHLFAVMNGIEFGESYTGGYSTLVGWGGDSAQLLQDIKTETGTEDELVEIVRTKYLGIKGQFGPADLISDLDAPIILNAKTNKNTFASIIKNYYESDDYKNRVENFVALTFPNVKKDALRTQAFSRYTSDLYIKILECKYGVRSEGFLGCLLPGDIMTKYKYHEKAAVYAFADYLASNY